MKTQLYSYPQSILRSVLAERDEGPIARLVAFKVPHCIPQQVDDLPVDEKLVAAAKNSVLKAYLSLVENVLQQVVASDGDYATITLKVDDSIQTEIDNALWEIVSFGRTQFDGLDVGLGQSFRSVFFYLVTSRVRRHIVNKLESQMTRLLQLSSETRKAEYKCRTKSVGIWGLPVSSQKKSCSIESYKVNVELFYRHLASDVSYEEYYNNAIESLKGKIFKFNTVCVHLKELEKQEKIGGCLYGK